MKNFFVLFIVITFLGMSACTQKVNIEAEKVQVKTVLDNIITFVETEDMDLFAKIYAHDPDMINFGTDAAERVIGYESYKEMLLKQNTSYETTRIAVRDQVIKVHNSGQVAWFSQIMDWDLMAEGQNFSLQGLRMTGVLDKRDGNWVIVQSHFSVPVSQQAAPY